MRHKCDCGYRTFNKRRLKRHQRNCEPPSDQKTIVQLREEAKAKGMTGIYSMNKQELIDKIKGA